jgi:hypothetical protein
MGREVGRLFNNAGDMDTGVFVMGGHEDGVIAFGRTVDDTGCALMRVLAQGYECGSSA